MMKLKTLLLTACVMGSLTIETSYAQQPQQPAEAQKTTPAAASAATTDFTIDPANPRQLKAASGTTLPSEALFTGTINNRKAYLIKVSRKAFRGSVGYDAANALQTTLYTYYINGQAYGAIYDDQIKSGAEGNIKLAATKASSKTHHTAQDIVDYITKQRQA